MILCKEIGKHFPNKIFSIGRCFVFDSINWIGSLISNGYWYYCHVRDVAPGPLITSHDECSSELFFFFIKMCFAYWQSVSALSLYFIISRANVYWSIELEGGGGYVIKFKSLSKAFRKGRFFKFFFKLKRQVLD